MEIHPVDPADDVDFHTFFEALHAGETYGREDMPMWSESAARVEFGQHSPTESLHGFAAVEDGEVVGAGVMFLIHNANTDKAFLGVAVPPRHRRRGVGTAIEEHLAREAAALDRGTLICELHLPPEHSADHPYLRFAQKRGYTPANTEVKRMLRLPVADELLDRCEAEAAPHAREYRLETVVDLDFPADLVDSYCELVGQLAVDAPTGDLDFEADVVTPEWLESRRAKNAATGTRAYATLAVAPNGEVVAHSVLVVPGEDAPNVYQYGTMVRHDHRGHRLGMAVKVRNLRMVQEAHPDRTRVFTQNSEVNGPMVAINDVLGFRPVEVTEELQRFL